MLQHWTCMGCASLHDRLWWWAVCRYGQSRGCQQQEARATGCTTDACQLGRRATSTSQPCKSDEHGECHQLQMTGVCCCAGCGQLGIWLATKRPFNLAGRGPLPPSVCDAGPILPAGRAGSAAAGEIGQIGLCLQHSFCSSGVAVFACATVCSCRGRCDAACAHRRGCVIFRCWQL